MPFPTFAVWHVFAAAAASFVFGAVWYGVLANPWMAALGKTREQIEAQGPVAVPIVISLVLQVLMAYVLATALGLVSGEAIALGTAIGAAAMIWLGFVMTTMVTNHRYGGASWSLSLIDGAHWLGVLVIQAVVLALLA